MIASVSSGSPGRRAAASEGGSSADICRQPTDSAPIRGLTRWRGSRTSDVCSKAPLRQPPERRRIPLPERGYPRCDTDTEGDPMSTGLIIAIVVIVALIIVLFAVVMPRARAKAREREVARRRDEVAGAHRERAEDRAARAEIAEHEARRERAEAELHESRARLHERGLADEELDADRDRLGVGDDRDERFPSDQRDAGAPRDTTVPPEERR